MKPGCRNDGNKHLTRGGEGALKLIYSSPFLEQQAFSSSPPTPPRPTSLISWWSIPSLCNPHREKTQLEPWPNDCVNCWSIGNHHLRGAGGRLWRGEKGPKGERVSLGWRSENENVGMEKVKGLCRKTITANNRGCEGHSVKRVTSP